jgi:hypothetical protein
MYTLSTAVASDMAISCDLNHCHTIGIRTFGMPRLILPSSADMLDMAEVEPAFDPPE